VAKVAKGLGLSKGFLGIFCTGVKIFLASAKERA
jgi:hypothetical protein